MMETPRDRIAGWLAHLERLGYGDETLVNETLGVTAGDLRALVDATGPEAELAKPPLSPWWNSKERLEKELGRKL